MKIDPVKYYYMDPETGMEMEFTKSDMWGYAVGFKNCSVEQMLSYDGLIPWPELSVDEKAVVDRNYEELRNRLKEEEDDC